MKIEVVLTEAEIVQELTEAVEARDLPEKFFYWSPLAVRAWLARAADPAFVGLRRAWQQLAAKAAWLLEPFEPPIHAISFGAGDGSTDRLLLDAIRQSGREQKYYPVDASQALLEMACAGAEDLDIETAGIKADISSPMHLVFASDAAESPKLLLMSGNTLGGFDPLDHVKHMAQCLHGDDRLILDAEIYQTNGSVPHGDSLRPFRFAPLAARGGSADDGEVRFEHKRDKSIAGLHVTASHFRPDRDLRIATPGHEVLVERGEHINLNFSYRFTSEALHELLVERGGSALLHTARRRGDGLAPQKSRRTTPVSHLGLSACADHLDLARSTVNCRSSLDSAGNFRNWNCHRADWSACLPFLAQMRNLNKSVSRTSCEYWYSSASRQSYYWLMASAVEARLAFPQ